MIRLRTRVHIRQREPVNGWTIWDGRELVGVYIEHDGGAWREVLKLFPMPFGIPTSKLADRDVLIKDGSYWQPVTSRLWREVGTNRYYDVQTQQILTLEETL